MSCMNAYKLQKYLVAESEAGNWPVQEPHCAEGLLVDHQSLQTITNHLGPV